MTAHTDLSSVRKLAGSLPAVYRNFGGARAASNGVGGRTAAVKEGVNNRTVLGVVEELVNTRHLVEEDAAVPQ